MSGPALYGGVFGDPVPSGGLGVQMINYVSNVVAVSVDAFTPLWLVDIPADWNTYSVNAVWAVSDAGSGDVAWIYGAADGIDSSLFDPSDLVAEPPVAATPVTSGLYVMQEVELASGLTRTGTVKFSFQRSTADGDDFSGVISVYLMNFRQES